MCLKNTNDCKRRLVLSGLQQVLIDILHTFPNSYSIQYTLICEILWELIRHPIILRATTTTTTTTTKGEEEDEEQQQEEQQQMIEKWKTKDLVQGFELVLIQLATDERFEALCEKIFQLLDFLLKNPAICEEKSHLGKFTSFLRHDSSIARIFMSGLCTYSSIYHRT
jgi:hypothetical protein